MRPESGLYEEEKVPGKPEDLKLFRRLVPFILPYKPVFFLSVFLMILIAALDLSVPYITKTAIDRYIVPVKETGTGEKEILKVFRPDVDSALIKKLDEKYPSLFFMEDGRYALKYSDMNMLTPYERILLRSGDIRGLMITAIFMIFIILSQFIFNFIQKLVMEIAGQRIMHDLRMHLFNHIQALPVSFFNLNPVGRLVTRVTNDVQNLHELFTSVIVFLFKDIFLIVGIAVLLSLLSWRLSLFTFMILPFVLLLTSWFARHARDVFRELRLKVSQINTGFSETIQGIRVIQLFRDEKRNEERLRRLNHDNYLAGMRQIHIFALFMPAIDVLSSVALALIIYYGGSGVISETITLGTLVAFISYMKMFFRPVRDVAEKFNIIQSSMASAERIFHILDDKEDPEFKTAGSEFSLPSAVSVRTVEFVNVDFSYTSGIPVLQDISFKVNKGESIAVVGPTGAGKTSLINLFMRFYDSYSGEILINGTDIRQIDKRAVRAGISLVNQDPFLFSGTIRENILSGGSPAAGYTLDEIIDAANCRSLINRLPGGAEAKLAEGAFTLSSGERQLISIARAIACDPDLIILDEATSYIDTESEVKIQKALKNLMASRTSVIIAHRLSTAKHADTILVMNRGKIVESGTHETLLSGNGQYKKLYTSVLSSI